MNASLVVVCVCAVTTGRELRSSKVTPCRTLVAVPVGHAKPPPNKCEDCGTEFVQRQSLRLHQKSSETCGNPEQHNCELCRIWFTQKSSLKRHKESKTHKKKIKCVFYVSMFIQSVCRIFYTCALVVFHCILFVFSVLPCGVINPDDSHWCFASYANICDCCQRYGGTLTL